MDDWLASENMWRKLTPGGNSLFRAVAEQVFLSQSLYEKISQRVLCKLGLENESQLDTIPDEDIITSLCELFKLQIFIYKTAGQPPMVFSANLYTKEVKLCQTGTRHYDSVYPKTFLESVALCQSITYELLYERVFNVSSPMDKSRDMIYNKSPYRPFRLRTYSYPNQYDRSSMSHSPVSDSELDQTANETCALKKSERGSPVFRNTPFPYKVAKAMMVDMYRNMEYDIWNESKNECEQEDEHALFSPGDKCQVTLDSSPDRVYNAHIQELGTGADHLANVFVEELGEKHIVQVANLIPIAQAHQLESPNYRRRTKKKDLPLVVTVPSKNVTPRYTLPHRPHQQVTAEGHSFHQGHGVDQPLNSSPSSLHIPVRLSSPAWRGRSRGSFGRRSQVINSAGHLLRERWPMERFVPTAPPRNEVFHFGRSQSEDEEGVLGEEGLLSTTPADDPAIVAAVYSDSDFVQSTIQRHMQQQQQVLAKDESYQQEEAVAAGCEPAALTLDVSGGASSHMGMLSQPQQPANMPCPPNMCGYPGPSTAACPSGAPHTHGVLPQQYGGPGYMGPPPPCYPYMVMTTEQDAAVMAVNYNACPSTDPSGADLPLHDLHTLQFFYNYGIEHYRMAMPFMQMHLMPQQQQQQQVAAPQPYLNQRYTTCQTYTTHQPHASSVVYTNGGALDDTMLNGQSSYDDDDENHASPHLVKDTADNAPPPQLPARRRSREAGDGSRCQVCLSDELGGEEEKPGSDEAQCTCCTVDKSCGQDSGCGSDSDPVSDEGAVSPTHLVTDHLDSSSHQSSTSPCFHDPDGLTTDKYFVPSTSKAPLRNPNRNGGRNVKMSRPMKDIPPRFKKLLEAAAVEKSAAMRSRQLEGLPLVRQLGPGGKGKQHVIHSPTAPALPQLTPICGEAPQADDVYENGFNPNAQCFVPGQPYDSTSPCEVKAMLTSNGLPLINSGESADGTSCMPGSSESSGHKLDLTKPRFAPAPMVSRTGGPPYTIHVVNAGAHRSCKYPDSVSPLYVPPQAPPSGGGSSNGFSLSCCSAGSVYSGPTNGIPTTAGSLPPPPPPPPAPHHHAPFTSLPPPTRTPNIPPPTIPPPLAPPVISTPLA